MFNVEGLMFDLKIDFRITKLIAYILKNYLTPFIK